MKIIKNNTGTKSVKKLLTDMGYSFVEGVSSEDYLGGIFISPEKKKEKVVSIIYNINWEIKELEMILC